MSLLGMTACILYLYFTFFIACQLTDPTMLSNCTHADEYSPIGFPPQYFPHQLSIVRWLQTVLMVCDIWENVCVTARSWLARFFFFSDVLQQQQKNSKASKFNKSEFICVKLAQSKSNCNQNCTVHVPCPFPFSGLAFWVNRFYLVCLLLICLRKPIFRLFSYRHRINATTKPKISLNLINVPQLYSAGKIFSNSNTLTCSAYTTFSSSNPEPNHPNHPNALSNQC